MNISQIIDCAPRNESLCAVSGILILLPGCADFCGLKTWSC